MPCSTTIFCGTLCHFLHCSSWKTVCDAIDMFFSTHLEKIHFEIFHVCTVRSDTQKHFAVVQKTKKSSIFLHHRSQHHPHIVVHDTSQWHEKKSTVCNVRCKICSIPMHALSNQLVHCFETTHCFWFLFLSCEKNEMQKSTFFVIGLWLSKNGRSVCVTVPFTMCAQDLNE